MRVHNEKKIQRRPGIQDLKDYRDAKTQLKEDFHDLCGYCGKNSEIMNEKFHIDHFVPKSLAPEREKDYYNLVWACPKCNLSKSNKWPTKDIHAANDRMIGFVDPASEEFDEHLERNEKGFVVGRTVFGEDICKNLNFDIRRTNLFWKIQCLYEIQAKLEAVHAQLDKEELQYYMQTNIFLKKYIKQSFEKGE